MQQKVQADTAKDYIEVEWQARVDLAAAHRIAVMEGLHEGIFNHLTLRVPGKDRYYQIPCACLTSSAPLISSNPTLSKPTVGLST